MKRLSFSLLLFLCTTFMRGQEGYTPSPENLAARTEFQDAKFGVFIHWGVYSMLADGEWVMYGKRIPREEYAHLPAGFCPSRFDANEWVRAIKAAGAKYITITSRHHDGFSMFATKATTYNIVDATPFRRDIIAELAEACRREGLKLNFYYSHMDWYRTDYPMGSTSKDLPHDEALTDWPAYYKFMNQQLTELLTQYGPIGCIWFDGMWDHDVDTGFDWQLDEQYVLIHRLQPACLIGNNHHKALIPGEDIQIFEQDLPGENTAGFSGDQKVSTTIPLESCQTMNNTWGYSITDKAYKSTDELIRRLVKAAGMNGNLLLNIGPRPDGQLPTEALERLGAIGEWMQTYGSTIYDTRGGFVAPQEWGVTTQRGNTLYIHVTQPDATTVTLPISPRHVRSVKTFLSGDEVKVIKGRKPTSDQITIDLTLLAPAPDRVVVVQLK